MKEALLKKARKLTARTAVLGGGAPGGPLAVKELPKATSSVRKLPKVPNDWGRKKSVAYVPREA